MPVGKTLNGNILCAIALNCVDTEIYEVCILPLDKNLNPMYEKIFDKSIRTDGKPKTKRLLIQRYGSDVWDAFDLWYEETIKKGQILPLGHDWPLTHAYLDKFFMGVSKNYFHETVRDVKVISTYLNDLAECNDMMPLPFPKPTLKYLANMCDCPISRDPSALDKAKTIALIYKKMSNLRIRVAF